MVTVVTFLQCFSQCRKQMHSIAVSLQSLHMDLCVFDFKSELRSFRVVIRDVSHLIFFTTTTTTITTTTKTTTKTTTTTTTTLTTTLTTTTSTTSHLLIT